LKPDLVIINDAEARQLAEEPNLIKAGARSPWGPSTLIAKRGEYGAAMFTGTSTLRSPHIRWKQFSIQPGPAIIAGG
jgi:hypothetical protein